tara:strand:- start:838 stop:1599 length:762 start_codon:yes stop_codon:yes gene_type:complete
MFSNNIEFSIHPDLSDSDIIKPKPAKKLLPDWYKNVDIHGFPRRNIKGCMPFLDGITAGYTLPLPQDFNLNYNFYNEELQQYGMRFHWGTAVHIADEKLIEYNLNGHKPQEHNLAQAGGNDSFPIKKNGKDFNILKILNPWLIKTPPGYSCLFIPPIMNENDYFSIIPAIVDTDTYKLNINFPFIVNGDLYPKFEKMFKQGTPYAQVIPFKRESWKSKFSEIDISKNKKDKFNFLSSLHNVYKNKVWHRKKWE